MELLLIRHGESIGNAERRIQGQADFPLTERGREQACALAERLLREERAVSTIYASDLSRAAQTAEILAANMNVPIIFDTRLREYDAGVLNGLVWDEIEHLYPEIWRGLQDNSVWRTFPKAEGNESFCTRLAAALTDIRANNSEDDTVAVVSHGGSLGTILAHLLGMDTGLPAPFRFGNTSLSIVAFGPDRMRLALMNDTCHLDGNLR
jgi:broad specificity phosphatase PhoE